MNHDQYCLKQSYRRYLREAPQLVKVELDEEGAVRGEVVPRPLRVGQHEVPHAVGRVQRRLQEVEARRLRRVDLEQVRGVELRLDVLTRARCILLLKLPRRHSPVSRTERHIISLVILLVHYSSIS